MCNHVCSSGSKDYVIEVGDSAVGPWTKIAEGQMEASKPFPLIEITLGHPHSGRFVQYRCVTWWSNYCGLQFIEVYKTGGKYFSWADGTEVIAVGGTDHTDMPEMWTTQEGYEIKHTDEGPIMSQNHGCTFQMLNYFGYMSTLEVHMSPYMSEYGFGVL